MIISPVPVSVIKTVNEAACELFGYAEGELVGQNISILCGGGHGAQHDMYLQKYLQKERT